MSREGMVRMSGEVAEVLPSRRFRVRIEGGELALVTPAVRLRGPEARFMVGDAVVVDLSPYDLSRGRIVGRPAEGGS